MNDSDKILNILINMQGQMGTMQNQINTVQRDVKIIKSDLDSTQGKVNIIQSHLNIMQPQLIKQGKDMSDIKQAQARTNTALETLAEGQIDIREHMATKAETASKADIQDLKADVNKKIKTQDRRLDIIEDELDLPHPNKN